MALHSLLEKLSPMAMMEDSGTERARIAIGLLEKQAAGGPIAQELAECGGLRILVQTMVLHPEATLRQGACSVLSAALHEGEDGGAFMIAAQTAKLPQGLMRVLAEEDRKARPKAGEKAVDPDLPLRRVALPVLALLVARVPELLDDPATASTVLCAAGSCDHQLRRGSVALALFLATDEATLAKVVSAADLTADKVAAALLVAWDDEELEEGEEAPTVREAVVRLLLLLRASDELRNHLAWAGALDALAAADEATPEMSEMLDALREWMGRAPPPPEEPEEGEEADE